MVVVDLITDHRLPCFANVLYSVFARYQTVEASHPAVTATGVHLASLLSRHAL